MKPGSNEYKRNHMRVYRARGRATEHLCTDCGSPARQWAQLHGTDGSDPCNYAPMCVSCHNSYDADVKGARISAALVGHTVSDEVRAKLSEAGKGRKQSTAHVEKRASVLRGKKRAPFTDAHRAALRAAWKKRRPSEGGS